MIQKSYDGKPCLYLIPTPIGNLEDITIRSLNCLKMVDILLCEDTRNTGILLANYDIHTKLVSCHEYNENKIADTVISYLKEGKNVGLVTDQGTPIITAFVPALTVSGLEPSPFLFYGFLHNRGSKQIEELKTLKAFPYTLIFYESVHRLKNTLISMLDVFGNRNISLCRELSKIHEEIIRDSIENIIPLVDSLKGEFVIVIEGNKEVVDYSNLDVLEHVKVYLDDGISEKEAIKIVAKERNVAKSVIYQEYHKRK